MPTPIHSTLIWLSLVLLAGAVYFRLHSGQFRERLDRTKEGWPILVSLRLCGVGFMVTTAAWLWNPARFEWATVPLPDAARWFGVGGFALAGAWLFWMFATLGRNLTDTVVTRRDATLVDHGPYRYVRNPMYTGVLMLGVGIGLALGTWLLPLGALLTFTLLAIRTRTEESYLLARFGDSYRDYMLRVGRFLPRIATPPR